MRIGWNPTWCKCANHSTTLWLRLYNLSNCIPCPSHTFIRGLSTFWVGGWAYGFILTLLPTQMLPQISESWVKLYLMQVCKPFHYALVEAVEPVKPGLCPWHTCMRCLSICSGCGWAYGFTFTSLPPQVLPQICERWLKSYPLLVCKPCHYTLVEAVEPFKLHPVSMPYLHEVFERLVRFWMGIWLHTHIITTTDASPDLWELAEILPDASVQNITLCFDWGCRTFQTASHVHVIHIWGV